MTRPGIVGFDRAAEISDLAVAVKKQLRQPGAALIPNFPIDSEAASLVRFGAALGTLSTRHVSVPLNKWIQRVEDADRAVQEPGGYDVLSATNRFFPWHTDEFHSPHPAEFVVQLCVRAAACGGGETMLAFLDDLWTELAADSIAILSQHQFSTGFGATAVLVNTDQGRGIRYNRDRLVRYGLTEDQLRAVNDLEKAIDTTKCEFPMRPGDCLAFNNRTVLHGRTGFAGGSSRLLLRMRVFEGALPSD